MDLSDLDFMIAGDLARELVRRLGANRDDDEVSRVFRVIEDQLDALVHLRELILTGVLESLLGDIDRDSDVTSADFERLFGPTTRRLANAHWGRPGSDIAAVGRRGRPGSACPPDRPVWVGPGGRSASRYRASAAGRDHGSAQSPPSRIRQLHTSGR